MASDSEHIICAGGRVTECNGVLPEGRLFYASEASTLSARSAKIFKNIEGLGGGRIELPSKVPKPPNLARYGVPSYKAGA